MNIFGDIIIWSVMAVSLFILYVSIGIIKELIGASQRKKNNQPDAGVHSFQSEGKTIEMAIDSGWFQLDEPIKPVSYLSTSTNIFPISSSARFAAGVNGKSQEAA